MKLKEIIEIGTVINRNMQTKINRNLMNEVKNILRHK